MPEEVRRNHALKLRFGMSMIPPHRHWCVFASNVCVHSTQQTRTYLPILLLGSCGREKKRGVKRRKTAPPSYAGTGKWRKATLAVHHPLRLSRLSTMSTSAGYTTGASTAVGRSEDDEPSANLDQKYTTALTPFEKVLADTARRREANAKRENAFPLKESSKLKVYKGGPDDLDRIGHDAM